MRRIVSRPAKTDSAAAAETGTRAWISSGDGIRSNATTLTFSRRLVVMRHIPHGPGFLLPDGRPPPLTNPPQRLERVLAACRAWERPRNDALTTREGRKPQK